MKISLSVSYFLLILIVVSLLGYCGRSSYIDSTSMESPSVSLREGKYMKQLKKEDLFPKRSPKRQDRNDVVEQKNIVQKAQPMLKTASNISSDRSSVDEEIFSFLDVQMLESHDLPYENFSDFELMELIATRPIPTANDFLLIRKGHPLNFDKQITEKILGHFKGTIVLSDQTEYQLEFFLEKKSDDSPKDGYNYEVAIRRISDDFEDSAVSSGSGEISHIRMGKEKKIVFEGGTLEEALFMEFFVSRSGSEISGRLFETNQNLEIIRDGFYRMWRK